MRVALPLLVGIVGGAALLAIGFRIFMDPGPERGVQIFLRLVVIAFIAGLVTAVTQSFSRTVRAAGLGLSIANAGAVILFIWVLFHSRWCC